MMVEVSIKKKNFEGRKRLRFARTMSMERRDVRPRGVEKCFCFVEGQDSVCVRGFSVQCYAEVFWSHGYEVV